MTYQDQITQVAMAQGVDPALALAVARKESGFNPSAVSSKGAVGLFQLMPGTASDLGVNAYDPIQNIQGGIAYLKKLLGQYDGDTALALAAYNAGPGNVDKYGGVPPFAETQNYVGSILDEIGLTSDNWSSPDLATQTASVASTMTMGFDITEPSVWFPIALASAIAIVIWNR